MKPTKTEKIYHRLETEEPQCCEYKNCQNELNGLNHLWIIKNKDFCFDIWLCNRHYKKFLKLQKIVER